MLTSLRPALYGRQVTWSLDADELRRLQARVLVEADAALEGEDLEQVLALVEAVRALDPAPRTVRWRSLTYCVLDAVWSIGARYDTVVVPLVRRVAAEHGDPDPLTPADQPLPPDPVPLHAFLNRFSEPGALVGVTNSQRTSPRGGVLKADAARAHARAFVDHGVHDLRDVDALMADHDRFAHLDATLAALPGEGSHGLRRGYLWMLAGDDDRVKPDRRVLRWLVQHGVAPDLPTTGLLLRLVAKRLTDSGRPTTAWEVDHAIWRDAARTGNPRAGR